MSALLTRIEKEAGRPLTPLQIFDITAARETTLSRLLMLYISTGLLFMLLPGTFLGVWNLLAISSHHPADSVSPGWIADEPRTGLVTGSSWIPNALPVAFDRVETLIPPIDSRFISGDNLATMMFAEIRSKRLVPTNSKDSQSQSISECQERPKRRLELLARFGITPRRRKNHRSADGD